jgi:hypothetical protein
LLRYFNPIGSHLCWDSENYLLVPQN